jgi:hypothetical protein
MWATFPRRGLQWRLTLFLELGDIGAELAMEISGVHCGQNQGAAGEVVFGERRLDRRLADGEPVEGGVELVLIDRTEAELLTEAGLAVSGDSARAAASLEPGSRRRLTTRARTRSRQRLPSGPSRRSRPILRAVPRAAATCPCGSERMMMIAG